jgi:hypothetical protein
MSRKTTPLYMVCSPHRCGGKTLVSRLLTEYYVIDDRPVTAFDLADEGPQLTDYLPQFTTLADINDICGQMAFFERLIAEDEGAKVIDVSRRTFKNFFTIAQEISLFAEARRHCIEPLILFMVDPDPKSPEVYASLRRRFTDASLLPVRNMVERTSAILNCDIPPRSRAAPVSLEIPLLSFSLRALIDRQQFSFSEFWRTTPASVPKRLNDELQDWVEYVFFQCRELELCLGCEDTSTRIAGPSSRRPHVTHRHQQWDVPMRGGDFRERTESEASGQPIDVPEEVLKYAPKKKQH